MHAKRIRSALAIQKRIAEANSAVIECQLHLAVTLSKVGDLLVVLKRPDEAMNDYMAALAIQQKLARANPDVVAFQAQLASNQDKLGNLLGTVGRPDEVPRANGALLARIERLIGEGDSDREAMSKLARAYLDQRLALDNQGDRAGATHAADKALEISSRLSRSFPTVPDYAFLVADAHVGLGDLAMESEKESVGFTHYRDAVKLARSMVIAFPESAFNVDFYYERMVFNLSRLGQRKKALEYARDRQRLGPDLPERKLQVTRSLCNHLDAAKDELTADEREGVIRDALDGLTRAIALGLDSPTTLAEDPDLAPIREPLLAMLLLDARLTKVMKGEQAIEDDPERLRLAQRASDTAFHATAARLWAEALAADPKSGDDRKAQYRFHAACAAVMAGSGQGKDNPKPDDASKSTLRVQALRWLKAELSAWRRVDMTVGPGNKELVAKTLEHWKTDADLAGVREEKALAALPEAERAEWQSLWDDVAALIQKTRKGPSGTP